MLSIYKEEVVSPDKRNKTLKFIPSKANLVSESSKAENDDYPNQVSYDTEKESFKWSDLVWRNIIIFIVLHSLFVYGGHIMIVEPYINWKLMLVTYLLGTF